jgi:hypothetical protein
MATTATTTMAADRIASVMPSIEEDTTRVWYSSGGYSMFRPVLTGDKTKKTFETIPTVDVGNIFSPDINARKAIAAEVAKACEEVGFFYAINPPVSYEKMGMCSRNSKVHIFITDLLIASRCRLGDHEIIIQNA